jgi:oxysterol-binding protein-related protein 9/10/11
MSQCLFLNLPYFISFCMARLFYGHWPDVRGSGEQSLVVEQVSHHPPITAYFIENKSKGLVLQGHNAQKTSFSAGAIIGQ